MFNKSFISVLIVTSAFTLIFGQTPDAKKDKDTTPQAFAWSFAGDGAYLGVQTQEVSKENFAKFGLRDVRGVAVEKVMENSPAAAAGLRDGDVIVRFNGEEVTSSRKLTRLISEVSPDHQVSLTVMRGGREQEMTVTLGKHPMPKFESGNFTFSTPTPFENFDFKSMPQFKELPQMKDMPQWKEMPQMKDFPQLKDMPQMKEFQQLKDLPQLKDMPQWKDFPKGEMPQAFGEGKGFAWRSGEGRQIGVSVYPLTKQLGERFGVESGVMISDVRENSPAAKAGLKAGDIVVEINGKPVKGDFDLIRTINEKKEGDVTLTIVRDKNRQTISVTPEASKDSGFFFQTDDENGLTAAPQVAPMRVSPSTSPAPTIAPLTLVRPGRVI